MDFEVIPFEDIVWGPVLGAGSFGQVYKGTYLGLDIAIKEILPRKDYDANKYFMREHLLMRECRHPNIVLFLGLAHEPAPGGRTFICSEFIPSGNLRSFIQENNRPFPWRLRISFATDISRAVAYLHARKCIHRDLKGENLLITSNDRVKVTDFGFARIAARNDDEMRRMSYCGTDGYMSPEILMGMDFDERTDVFSLGIIFAEIASRRLVHAKKEIFTRFPPSFSLGRSEVERLASHGCPPDFINLIMRCVEVKPDDRPAMPEVLERLRKMEIEILSRLTFGKGEHVGSIKIVKARGRTGQPGGAKGLASFFDKREPSVLEEAEQYQDAKEHQNEFEYDTEEEEVAKMMEGSLKIEHGERATTTWRTARWDEPHTEKQTVMDLFSNPPTKIPGSYPSAIHPDPAATSSSVITVKGNNHRGAPAVHEEQTVQEPAQTQSEIPSRLEDENWQITHRQERSSGHMSVDEPESSPPQTRILPATHRFSMVGKTYNKPGFKKQPGLVSSAFAIFGGHGSSVYPRNESKCHACGVKIGRRPAMECDDCHVFVHVKCSDRAPVDCGKH